jgi:prevent-host-death family protein
MRFASVAEVKNRLSEYLARARRTREPIIVTHHGKPYALIQPLAEDELGELEWRDFARKRLARAWEGEPDERYDYLRLSMSSAPTTVAPTPRSRGGPDS